VGAVSSGRTWAYVGVIFGAAGSVAANVGHAFVKPDDAPATWEPQLGAILWGVAVAVALLISVEVLARCDWPDTVGWRFVRYVAGGVVGLVAAGASYKHLSDLLADWYETRLVVIGGPAIVDGLMVLCSFALMAPKSTPVDQSASIGQPIDRGDQTPDPAADSPSGLSPDRVHRIEPDGPIGSADRAPTDRVDSNGSARPTDGRPGRGQSTRSTARSRTSRSSGRGRSDDDLRMELTRAQQMGRLAMTNPSAESIRKELRVGIEKARQLRDELTQEPVAKIPQDALPPMPEGPDA
jgi:hypothetical protein